MKIRSAGLRTKTSRVARGGVVALVSLGVMGCGDDRALFSRMDNTGIEFANTLVEDSSFDVFRYRNYYNGGGVGIADLTGDGLPEVYLVSNLGSNRLYLNVGDFRFRDITEESGVGGTKPWSTGVSIADVNGDGWLDLYVCNSGDLEGRDRGNELFLNQGDGTFQEQAHRLGLDDGGFSTHAAFFDFDQDGDLDCYVLNNSFRPVASLPIKNTRDQRDPDGGDRFYLNQDGVFEEASQQVGIFGSVIGFGLGITCLDANRDGWTDLYISNDFFERDYLYINMEGNRFSEQLVRYMNHTSLFSMGSDAADLDNDGLEEIFVTDMLPSDRARLKRTTSFDTYDRFQLKYREGFYRQYMKNTLQYNAGDMGFQEIARYGGVEATDWSWGALMFDMDSDGRKDIFVTNGIYKDVTNQDFIAYLADEQVVAEALEDSTVNFMDFVDRMPSNPLPNAAFRNMGSLKFSDMAKAWGLDHPSFSNGAAYGDLDSDGDLDLVVNNVNQRALVYRNNRDSAYHHLTIKLVGDGCNPYGLGALVKAYTGGEILSHRHFVSRGFQSSVDYSIVMGLGHRQVVDSLEIWWDAHARSLYRNVGVDTVFVARRSDASGASPPGRYTAKTALLTKTPFRHLHAENHFVDFDRERLLYHKLSTEGPALAVGDVNADGLDDFYIGGALGVAGVLYLNDGADRYEPSPQDSFLERAMCEDVDAVFFDADGDQDNDLYVVSGGNEHPSDSGYYRDRLYLNEGKGRDFVLVEAPLEDIRRSGSCARPFDFDGDGDMDLFVGVRSIPGRYGFPASSYLLENEGDAVFGDVTTSKISYLSRLGMVTDAQWADFDGDADPDLVVVGDWMSPVIFENRGSFLAPRFDEEGLGRASGLFRSVYVRDMDEDGDTDLILGNLGTNTMFRASHSNPISLYVGDTDRNGLADHILTFREGDDDYPYHTRDELASVFQHVKKSFPTYEGYSDKSVKEIFSPQQLLEFVKLEVNTLESLIAYNLGDGSFELKPIAFKAQWAPLLDIQVQVLGGETLLFLLGGFGGTRPEAGGYDASRGLVLKLPSMEEYLGHGLNLRGEVRASAFLRSLDGMNYLVARSDDYCELYKASP